MAWGALARYGRSGLMQKHTLGSAVLVPLLALSAPLRSSAQTVDEYGCWTVPPSCVETHHGDDGSGLDHHTVFVENRCSASIFATVCFKMNSGRPLCGSMQIQPAHHDNYSVSRALSDGTYKFAIVGSSRAENRYICSHRQFPHGIDEALYPSSAAATHQGMRPPPPPNAQLSNGYRSWVTRAVPSDPETNSGDSAASERANIPVPEVFGEAAGATNSGSSGSSTESRGSSRSRSCITRAGKAPVC